MIRAGLLADTHLERATELYIEQVRSCFADVDVIMHAGDLTDLSVLDVFADKEVHAVCGNMCNFAVSSALPTKKVIELGGFLIGLIHGAHVCGNIPDQLLRDFEQVDCIVYGHTHRPACHWNGGVLFVNPGSFMRTSRYGAVGTYAILEAGDKLRGSIHEIGAW